MAEYLLIEEDLYSRIELNYDWRPERREEDNELKTMGKVVEELEKSLDIDVLTSGKMVELLTLVGGSTSSNVHVDSPTGTIAEKLYKKEGRYVVVTGTLSEVLTKSFKANIEESLIGTVDVVLALDQPEEVTGRIYEELRTDYSPGKIEVTGTISELLTTSIHDIPESFHRSSDVDTVWSKE